MATLGAVVARNVRAERARLDWDQAQLALALGWSRTTVSNLESGTRTVTLDDVVPLCRALSVTFAQLIDRADPDDLAVLAL
jgi:transcriptional regulator with XRE-family HTH domain